MTELYSNIDRGYLMYVVTAITCILGGGGFVAIINMLSNRHRNKSEVTDINVKTAIELERVAMTRYTELSQTLGTMEGLIKGFRIELEGYRTYVLILQNLLRENGITFPRMPDARPNEK